MLGRTLALLPVALLGATASAQEDLGHRLRRITQPPREVHVRVDPLTHRAQRVSGEVGPATKLPVQATKLAAK